MPDLPARPDLEQLRHQAKDLLHAAQRGDPAAIARIRAVSDRIVLSAAQLALAREYGFASWAKLKLEVERRDILNNRDLSRLTGLLAEHPGLATSQLEHWADRACGPPLGYITMMRFIPSARFRGAVRGGSCAAWTCAVARGGGSGRAGEQGAEIEAAAFDGGVLVQDLGVEAAVAGQPGARGLGPGVEDDVRAHRFERVAPGAAVGGAACDDDLSVPKASLSVGDEPGAHP
jgi:hypothetical protein